MVALGPGQPEALQRLVHAQGGQIKSTSLEPPDEEHELEDGEDRHERVYLLSGLDFGMQDLPAEQ